VPRFGYECAAWDPPTWRGSAERIGTTETVSTSFADRLGLEQTADFGGVLGLSATFCDGGTLIGSNAGGPHGLGFAICHSCGYSDREKQKSVARENLPAGFASHLPLWKKKGGACWREGEAPVLRNYSLGAQVITDLLQVDFSSIFGPIVDIHTADQIALTLGHALRVAGAMLLEVDSRELAVISVRVGPAASVGIQIYESTPGGSGHLTSLMRDHKSWFEHALTILHGSDAHHARCQEACLECVLNAQSQSDFENGKLSRKKTLAYLEESQSAHTTDQKAVQSSSPAKLKPQERADRMARCK